MTCGMIVVLCDSDENARYDYKLFLRYLRNAEPGSIRKRYDACLCVETDSDLRYIFVDYRMGGVFRKMTLDLVDEYSFFDALLNEGEDLYGLFD